MHRQIDSGCNFFSLQEEKRTKIDLKNNLVLKSRPTVTVTVYCSHAANIRSIQSSQAKLWRGTANVSHCSLFISYLQMYYLIPYIILYLQYFILFSHVFPHIFFFLNIVTFVLYPWIYFPPFFRILSQFLLYFAPPLPLSYFSIKQYRLMFFIWEERYFLTSTPRIVCGMGGRGIFQFIHPSSERVWEGG
jgi:cellulose synthase/poly-beta-1,6-N-acetylglucosamine synthase-like glycosyltransferase